MRQAFLFAMMITILCCPLTSGAQVDDRTAYHAAASAAANFPIAALAIAERLFEAKNVPFDAARPVAEDELFKVVRSGKRKSRRCLQCLVLCYVLLCYLM